MSDSNRKWLLDEWAEAIGRALQSMADTRPAITWKPLEDPESFNPGEGSITVEVLFSLSVDSFLWITVPPETLQDLGTRTLRAAGIEDADAEEINNTFTEVMQQGGTGVSQALSSRLEQRVSSQLKKIEASPSGNPVFRFDFEYPDTPVFSAYIAVSPQLFAALEEPAVMDLPETPQADIPDVADFSGLSVNASNSRTFDILLDIAMPVSVSFGRTEMLIKDVLKLTTGSIIELNRAAGEPVDVIVNDCIIARGEVVVVDGNYGVRVHQIASRQERLRSSGQSLASIGKPEPKAVVVA